MTCPICNVFACRLPYHREPVWQHIHARTLAIRACDTAEIARLDVEIAADRAAWTAKLDAATAEVMAELRARRAA